VLVLVCTKLSRCKTQHQAPDEKSKLQL